MSDWEELDFGLDFAGVFLDVKKRDLGKLGKVRAGAERRENLRTEMELVMGLDVFNKLGATLNAEGDVVESFKMRWGTGNKLGLIQIMKMTDQSLPGMEIRALKRGTLFKMKTLKLPSLFSGEMFDRVELQWDDNGQGTVEIELPDSFFPQVQQDDTVIDVTATEVKALGGPDTRRLPPPGTPLNGASAPAVMMTVKDFEVEAEKRLRNRGFTVTITGTYRMGIGSEQDTYSTKAILDAVNKERARRELGPIVLN